MFRLLLDIFGGLKHMAADLTRLNAAVAALGTKVDAAIAEIEKLNTPDTTTQPAIDAAATAVEAANAKLDAEMAKVNPPAPTPPAG